MSDTNEQLKNPGEGSQDSPSNSTRVTGQSPVSTTSSSDSAERETPVSSSAFSSEADEQPRHGRESQPAAIQSSDAGQDLGSNELDSGPAAIGLDGRPIERKSGARGTAAMDPGTRQEVARKGGLAVSRNRQHMSEIGRKGGQSVSKNREHMAKIGRKGGAASRGHH